MHNKVIALETRLKDCPNVITLGVQANFDDYDSEAAALIRRADKIFYPTTFYAELFDTMGKKIFPSYHTYKCVQDKVKQTALFKLLGISHPRTRFFFGNRQKKTILDYFRYPFIAKIPRGSALGRGVFLITDETALQSYCDLTNVAYIQEYLPSDRDIRVVVIGYEIAHAYWRLAAPNQFRSNVAAGGRICFDPIPMEALDLALQTAERCRWDDVGLDILPYGKHFFVLEGNMKYGKEGFRRAGIDYSQMMTQKIEKGEI